jgi:hypothetical protein
MDYIQLNMDLCKKSPFILKTEIGKEDRVSFKSNQIAINEKIIGRYAITEDADHVKILVHAEGYSLHDALVIKLDYNDKPIFLTDVENSGKLSLEELDNFPRLIPEKQFLEDEKAEL